MIRAHTRTHVRTHVKKAEKIVVQVVHRDEIK